MAMIHFHTGKILTLFLGFLFCTPFAFSQSLWNAGTADWQNSLNWTPNGTPTTATNTEISNGGTAQLQGGAGAAFANSLNGSSGGLLVTGAGNSLTITNFLTVGAVSSGTFDLTISAGGTVTDATALLGVLAGSNSNTAVVTGLGSTWTTAGDLNVGFQGADNTLTIELQGQVLANATKIGGYVGATNNFVQVTGTDSLLSNTDYLAVGYGGNANRLTIENGGKATNGNAFVGFRFDVNSTSDNNVVVVQDLGSLWENTGTFSLGYYGSGNTLTISNQGRVTVNGTNQDALIGFSAGSNNNTMTVTGAGSEFANASTFYIGNDGQNNTLEVLNGGLVTSKNVRIGGGLTSTGNVAMVDGTDSTWNISGTLRVGSNGDSNSLNITDGGKVKVTGNSFVGYANTSSGNTVTVSGAGALLDAAALVVGRDGTNNLIVAKDGGTVKATSITLAQNAGSSGLLQIGAGGVAGVVDTTTITGGAGTAAVNFNHSNTVTFAPVLAGSLAVTKFGNGTTILSGSNTFTGGLTLQTGTIEVGHATALGAGNVTVNGGTLRALKSTLTGQALNVAGNYNQTGGTLYLRLFGVGNFDQLSVAGTAALGGKLQVDLRPGYVPSLGDSFLLVDATGGVAGQFSTVQTNLMGSLGFTMTYGPNDATGNIVASNILIEAVQLPFTGFATSPNQINVAQNLDTFSTSGQMKELIDYLNGLPGTALSEALDQLSPEELGALSRLSRSYNVTFNSNLIDRLTELRNGTRGFSARGLAVTDSQGEPYKMENILFAGVGSTPESVGIKVKKRDAMSAALDNPWGVFATGTGQFGDVDGMNGTRGYAFTTGGMTIGADYRWNEGFTTGAFVGYAGSEANLDGVGGKVEADDAKFGIYGSWQKKGFYVNGAAGGGYNDYETSRNVLGAKAEGDTNGLEFNALAGLGYDFTPGNWRFGPSAHVEYSYLLIDGFTERGSLAPLRVNDQTSNSLATRLGWNVSYGWELPNKVVIAPQASASWRHEYLDEGESLQSRLASGAGGVFNTQISGVNRDSALGSLSLLVQWTPTITTVVGYEAEVASRYSSSTVNGRIVFGF